MDINRTQTMPDADYIISEITNELFLVTTKLSSCDNEALNLNRLLDDLRIFYQNNMSNVFNNISIISFNCLNPVDNYFQQMISFTQAVSIRIQILFASLYFDYINANRYQFNGFMIDSKTSFSLSSTTVNNSSTYNACSAAKIAKTLLCPTNMTNSICTLLANPWTFTCSQEPISSTPLLEKIAISSGLNTWQLGLVCTFSIMSVLFLISISGFLYRRLRHTKQIALAPVNVYDEFKLMQKTGIPQGQAFQQAQTIIQPKRYHHTAISWIHDVTSMSRNDTSVINLKPPGSYNQVTFIGHAKIHDPSYPATRPKKSLTSANTLTSSLTNKLVLSSNETSTNQSKLLNDGLQENNSKNQSISNSQQKLDTLKSKQFINLSFIDENLTDEDAWMPILDIVNAELAKLNELDQTKTFISSYL